MEFVTVHPCTTLSVHLSLEVFIKTDRALPWKKQIINIAFYKIKNLQCGAYHKSCISMLFTLLLQITPSVSLRNACWTGALRGLEGEERLQGGRREEGKGMLTRALCTALWPSCKRLSESLKMERGTFGLHGPFGNLRDFTHRSRFLAFLEKSSVLAIPSQHFYRGRQLAGKWEAAAPLKQACSPAGISPHAPPTGL